MWVVCRLLDSGRKPSGPACSSVLSDGVTLLNNSDTDCSHPKEVIAFSSVYVHAGRTCLQVLYMCQLSSGNWLKLKLKITVLEYNFT